jgi:hypothetical protein
MTSVKAAETILLLLQREDGGCTGCPMLATCWGAALKHGRQEQGVEDEDNGSGADAGGVLVHGLRR